MNNETKFRIIFFVTFAWCGTLLGFLGFVASLFAENWSSVLVTSLVWLSSSILMMLIIWFELDLAYRAGYIDGTNDTYRATDD